MLIKRILTAVIGIPILVVLIWFQTPIPWFTVFISIWGILAAYEFYRLVSHFNVAPLTWFGLLWTLLFVISRDSGLTGILEPGFNTSLLVPFLLTSSVVFPLLWLLIRSGRERTFASFTWTVAGILYVGWLLGYMVAVRGLPDGRSWVYYTFFVTFGSDTMAFFAGRALGRNKLAPDISPAKTREGAVGGVLGAVIVSLLFLLPTPAQLPFNWVHAIILGILVSVFGQLGDLVESLLKRNAGVKDSGRLLPGHGGLLDRMDSVVFAGVVVYYYVVWVIL